MKNREARILACLIAVALVFEVTVPAPASVYAAQKEDKDSIRDKVIEKGEDYTIYEGEEGQETLEMYPYAVRTRDEEGELVDLDSSLKLSEEDPTEYVNKSGLADLTIPEAPSLEEPIRVEHDRYSFSFSPLLTDASEYAGLYERKTRLEEAENALKEKAPVKTTIGIKEYETEPCESKEIKNVKEETSANTSADELNDASEYITEESDKEDIQGPDDADQEEEISSEERSEEEESENDPAYEAEAENIKEEQETVQELETSLLKDNSLVLREAIEEKTEDLYHEEREKQTGLRFATKDPDVSLEYYATDRGVKENIILAKAPRDNRFSFVIHCMGTVPELKYRAILLRDKETGEETGAIQEPCMNDSSEADDHGYSEDLEYSIEPLDEEKGIYIVTLEVSREYLEDEERVYPVIIDPSYTANTSSTVQTAYVLGRHGTTNYYSSGIKKMCIGYGPKDGYARTYVHFPTLQSAIKGKYINSATFSFTEYENSAKNTGFGIYRVTGSWTNSKITYKNRPGYDSTAAAKSSVKGTSNYRQSLNITSLVQSWANGTYANNGIMLKANTESTSTKNFSSFFNANYGTASKRPVLSVTYTSPSPAVPGKPVNVRLNGAVHCYVKKNGQVKVSWEGANSNILDVIQWKLVRYTAADTYDTGTIVEPYSSTGVKTAAGSYILPAAKLSGKADGKYAVAIRGKDKGGNVGDGTIAYLHLDNTAPKPPAKIHITTERSKLGGEHDDEGRVTAEITSGGDLPATQPSGVGSYTVSLYKADRDTLLETKTVNAAASGAATAVFEGVEPGTKVYVKAVCNDRCGNKSTAKTSETVTVKDTRLPSFDEEGSFRSDLMPPDNWRSYSNTAADVSWKADYDGRLGGILLTVKDSSGKTVPGYSGTEILEEEGYPLEYNHLRLDRIIDFKSLSDGEYTIELKYIPESEMGEAEPYGRVKKLELGIDNIPPVIQGKILPDTEEPLSGMAQISCGASDDRTAVETRAYIQGDDGTYRELTLSSSNINLNTTEYDDGEYRIKYVFEDKAGNTSETERTYIFRNAAPTPRITLDETYGNGEIAFRYTYPGGDASASKTAKLQAAFVQQGKEPGDADYTDLSIADPGSSGEAELDKSGEEDGLYDVCIRSVDASGNTGKVRKQTYALDRTAPSVELTGPAAEEGDEPSPVTRLVPVRGTVSDPHLKSVKVSYATGETPSEANYVTVRTREVSDGQNSISGLLGTVDLTDESLFPAGTVASIRIEAEDKAGNKETVTRTVVRRETIDHDADIVIDKGNTDELHITEEHQSFRLKKKGAVYTPEDPVWLSDGAKTVPDSSGRIDFSDEHTYPDEAVFSMAVYDRTDSGRILFGVPTSEYIASDTRSAVTDENTADIAGGRITIPAVKTSAVYETAFTTERDTVSLRLDAEEIRSTGSTVRYYIAADEGELHEIEDGKEYLLTEAPFSLDDTGEHRIRMRAVLEKGTASQSPAIRSYGLTAKVLRSEQAVMDLMAGYDPITVTEVPQLNYKVKISWDMPEGLDTSDVTYEVYRSTSEDFPEENTVLVQEGLTETSWYDSYALIDKDTNANNHEGTRARARKIPNADFYYKVKAVKGYGTEHVRKSRGTEGSGVMLPAMDEYARRLGLKDYWGYSETDIGAGTGYTEQSRGNFVYQETDAYVKGRVLDLAMQRTYNSMSTGMTPLGYSWDFSFNPILLETYDSYGDSTGMLFKDGSGTIYTFRSMSEEQEENTGTETKETFYRSPLGVYIELKRTDTLDTDDADQDGDRNETTDTVYTVKTLSGDTYTFNRSCQITGYKDANGNEIIYTYDDHGRLTEVENPNGKSREQRENANASEQKQRCIIRFTYYDGEEDETAKELIRTAVLPGGQVVKYEYNSSKMLTASKLYGNGTGSAPADTSGEPVISTGYGYDAGNVRLMTSVTDPNGNVSSIGYAKDYLTQGRCSSVTYPNGDREEYSFDRVSEEDKLYDSMQVHYVLGGHDGGTESYRSNTDGNILRIQDVDGSVVSSTYRLGLEWESRGDVDVYEITDSGNITRRQETVTAKKTYNLLSSGQEAKIAPTDCNVRTETDTDGNRTTYEYKAPGDANRENPTGIVTRVRDGSDMHESFRYDDNGNLMTAADGDTGEKVTYTYDTNGQVLKETFYGTDGSTVTGSTAYTYDSRGNVTSEISTNGSSPSSTDRYVYDDLGRLTRETDARGYITDHEYDALDREIRTTYHTDGAALTEEKSYDRNGNLTREKDRDGRVISYTYDNMDRITCRTVSKGGESYTWKYSYTAADYTCTYESGSITYTGAAVTTVRNPDGEVSSITVQDRAGRTVLTEEKGLRTAYRYNRDGEAVETYTVGSKSGKQGETLGTTVLCNYDKNGNITAAIVDPGWNGTNYYVDDDTQVSRYTYDSLGNVLKEYDPMDHMVKHKYDSNGRMTRTTADAGDGTGEEASSSVKYDIPVSSGNTVTRMTNAMGQISETETDPSGSIVRVSDLGYRHDNGRRIDTTYTYDALGNLVSEHNANGTRRYTYDAMNNMTECVSVTGEGSDAVTERSTYTYDSFGMMTSRKDYTGDHLDREALFRYDCLKRLVRYYQGNEVTGEAEPDWISYSYDIEDNLTEIDYPSFMQTDKVLYTYDSASRLTKIRMKTHSSGNTSLVREYEYRNDNRVSAVNDYYSGSRYIRKVFSYDDIGHCTGIDVTDSKGNRKIESFRYTYDKCNNITTEEMLHVSGSEGDDEGDPDPDPAKTEHISSDGSYHIRRDYTYNDLSEITGIEEYALSDEGEQPAESLLHETVYTYDRAGNRTSETIDGETYTYTYDSDGLGQLTEIAAEGDRNGAKTKKYSYDGAGNLVTAADHEAGTSTAYSYDVSGEMVKAVVTGSDGSTITTVNTYDGSGTRIARKVVRKDSSGATLTSDTTCCIVSGGNILCTYSPEGDDIDSAGTVLSENIFGIDGHAVLTLRGTKEFIYIGDLRGSTTAIIDADGTAVQVCFYDAYGLPEIWGGFSNDILYTGAVYDSATGLYYLSSRYYNSVTGRFISEDSIRGDIRDPLSLNLYAYCEGNPVKYVDEDGHLPTIVVGAVVGAAVGAAWEAGSQMWSNKSFNLKSINWGKVGISAAAGALSGAIAGSGVGFAYSSALEGIIGSAEELGNQWANGEKIDVRTAAIEGAKASATSLIFAGINKSVGGTSYDITIDGKEMRGQLRHRKERIKRYRGNREHDRVANGGSTGKNSAKTIKKKAKIKIAKYIQAHRFNKTERKAIRKAAKRSAVHIGKDIIIGNVAISVIRYSRKLKKGLHAVMHRIKRGAGK